MQTITSYNVRLNTMLNRLEKSFYNLSQKFL